MDIAMVTQPHNTVDGSVASNNPNGLYKKWARITKKHYI